MKKIKSIGMSVLMLMGVAHFAFATSDVPFLEGVTTFDNPGVAFAKISTEPNFVISRHSGINSALAVLPTGFGVNNSSERFSAGTFDTGSSNKTFLNLILEGRSATDIPYVTVMQFFNGGPTGSSSFIGIQDGTPFLPPPPFRTFGGITFSSNVIAASTAALVSGAKVNTEIGSVLIYNSTTKTIETIDDVVVSLTRL